MDAKVIGDGYVLVSVVDQPNKNGRMYSSKGLAQALRDHGGEVLGMLAPLPGDFVDLEEVSHKLTDFKFEDGKCYGKLHVLSTPKGLLLKHMIEEKLDFGYALAGHGNVDANGIVTGFSIRSIDAVANPA